MKDLLAKYYEQKVKEQADKALNKSRKEVEINKNGSGYTIKEGSNKDKVLGHISTKSKEI
jgi:hypothetical protein